MRTPGIVGGVVLLLVLLCAPPGPAAATRQSEAVLTPVWSILNEWPETPDGRGLLPTAVSEAQVATQHAGLAAGSPESLEQMQVHARHVLHAVDPAEIAEGPGLGYGVRRASADVAAQIALAAGAEGASENVRTSTGEIAILARNTLARADEMVALVKAIDGSASAVEAAPLTERLYVLARQLTSGSDANGDGEIGPQPGEGGLLQIEASIGTMLNGEGLR